jgi:hypothetical protein
MDQINQFPAGNEGSANDKFKIVSLFLGIAVLILTASLVFVLFKRPAATENNVVNTDKAAQPIGSSESKGESAAAEGAKVSATTEEKAGMGIPDVSNIEIVTRDENGRPLSYRILRGGQYADADNDGLTDADEAKFGTDKDSVDTDGDGISDWQELGSGRDPKVKDDYEKK